MINSDQQIIFITGACGFVGEFLVDLLFKTKSYKLILNCRNKSNRHFQGHNIEYTDADLNSESSLDHIFETYQPNIVIHLAGVTRLKYGELNPNEAFQANYLGTKNLVKTTIRYKTPNFVFTSSDLANNHQSVIGITKFLAESYLQNLETFATRIVTIRLPNIAWTPGSVQLIFEEQIKKQAPITITDPAMSRRFITGDEAAQYIEYAVKYGTDKNLMVINKSPIKITHLAEEMMEETGVKVGIKYIGARPGEKLEEESYDEKNIKHTSFNDLSLLNRSIFGPENIAGAIGMLKKKPGFNLIINNILND